ncbi:hypothetical protein CBP29_11625 [Fischerella thermalis WC341]|nr:hypothetical protein CBP19_08610 [Fischerella thermalis WC1110]PLZ23892.1 hypothetical protein CBP29_11625 [Fischerella thermalis WC341]PLZ36142.1 hypothetical protein CBP26_22105 [Fischerella thermalis WC538]PLZ38842.1 hypothetical protein CBP25_23020 [Fischerella thermalis WC527]PLZ68538.1 hypothetical protein CBP23_01825 [Fischerella thermalis WC344]
MIGGWWLVVSCYLFFKLLTPPTSPNPHSLSVVGSPSSPPPHLPLSHSPTLPTYLQRQIQSLIFLINASGEVDVKRLPKL